MKRHLQENIFSSFLNCRALKQKLYFRKVILSTEHPSLLSKPYFRPKSENVMLKVNLPAKEKEVPSINVKNV